VNALLRLPVLVLVLVWAVAAPARAAESTTGIILGTVLSAAGEPVAGAHVSAVSGSGRYAADSDAQGRFVILGVLADTYVVSVQAAGFESVSHSGVLVLPAQSEQIRFTLARALRTIATVHAGSSAFVVGSTSDSFTVTGAAARATTPTESSSGLANYTAGTVQGAVASVPGVQTDAFANIILRGGKVDDAVFDYDSVPVPQGLIAEPGGNIVGAQLFTTGVGSTTVTLAGFGTQGDNALGGVIDQIPAAGTYPGRTTLELGDGIGPLYQNASLQALWATPDLRWRYAVASTFGSEYFSYGDGSTFYPSEAATYGLALQTRGQASVAGNVHYRPDQHDDVSFVALFGEANYTQYGSPYAGETYGAFDGPDTTFPGSPGADVPVTFASGVRGTYDVLKAQWVHTRARSLTRLQVYQSQFGSTAGGPFWDDLSFPDGVISLAAQQGGRQYGISYDVDDLTSDHHHVKYGVEYRSTTAFLDQVVPTAGEYIDSNPTLQSYLAYLGDTWSMSQRFDVTATLRASGTNVIPSTGSSYGVGAVDPHLSASYRLGHGMSLRATYDQSTVAPKPLEADRTDSTSPAPFVPLAPEIGQDLSFSLEGGGLTQYRVSYYSENESNVIDVLPYNFRASVQSGQSPNGVGVPTNAGLLRATGLEFWLKRGGLTLDAGYISDHSSSASQFAYNSLNAAAVAAGHLFPVGYVPDFAGTLSYEFKGKHVRATPALSYETGYPYGNGRDTWVVDPVTHRPVAVPNDNFVNPGYNYYFLRDPSQPYNAVANPYIGNLGTQEGGDPNTLRTPPQTLVSLHVEGDLGPRLTLFADAVNLLGVATPTQLQGNPYLIGPPGYAGGNLNYACTYGQILAGGVKVPCNGTIPPGVKPYLLGNGVPTNDGVSQALPWTYGRAGYVPEGYAMARSVRVGLRYRF
jgi:hypothetical protein